jgi:hypothetical protein
VLLVLVFAGLAIFRASTLPANDAATTAASSPEQASTSTGDESSNTDSAAVSELDGLLQGDVLLKESFDSNSREWFITDFSDEFGTYQARIVNGRYRLHWKTKQPVFVWEQPAAAGEFDNFIAVVDATPDPESDSFGYGLTFRGTDTPSYYTFEIYSDGFFRVRLNPGGGWQVLVDDTPTPAMQSGQTRQLAVQALGPDLSFFINGQQVATAQDQTLASGKIGLIITAQDGKNATVEYDNLVIRELSN